MSNPNWSAKKNRKVARRGMAQVRAKFAATCPGCSNAMKVGDAIFRNALDQWVCGSCARPTSAAKVTEARRRTVDWEHDEAHAPHSMSYPCDICDALPELRDVEKLVASRTT